MEFNVILHGVPNGRQFAGGTEQDQIALGTYYHGRYNHLKYVFKELEVNFKEVGGKEFIYYTYFLGGSISDVKGRGGSYFALSLKTDQYIQEVVKCYWVLEHIIQKHILGTILVEDKASMQYRRSFLQEDVPQIEDDLGRILGVVLNPQKIDEIKPTLGRSVKDSKTIHFNLLDASDLELLEELKKSGSISISPFWNSNREKQNKRWYEKNIAQLTQQKDSDIASLQKEVEQLDSEAKRLSEKINSSEVLNQNLKKKIEEKESELGQVEERLQMVLSQKEQLENRVQDLQSSLKYSEQQLRKQDSLLGEKTRKRKLRKDSKNIVGKIFGKGSQEDPMKMSKSITLVVLAFILLIFVGCIVYLYFEVKELKQIAITSTDTSPQIEQQVVSPADSLQIEGERDSSFIDAINSTGSTEMMEDESSGLKE